MISFEKKIIHVNNKKACLHLRFNRKIQFKFSKMSAACHVLVAIINRIEQLPQSHEAMEVSAASKDREEN